jgi:molybdenum cofactor cytidylyltransferase
MSNLRSGFGVVVLGAGRSRRMGQSKLLLPWGGTSVIGHLLAVWRAVGVNQIAVVSAADGAEVTGELDRLGFDAAGRILNPKPDQGMFSSIQCAARWSGWKPDLTHWIIALGDQPHLRQETFSKLCAFAGAHADRICQPAHNGRTGHPVVLPGKDFHELATTGARDLREFLRPRTVALCEVDDPGLTWDMDTPEDYRRMSGGGQLL